MTPSGTRTLPVPARQERSGTGVVVPLEAARRRPGRPRAEGHDERILAAAVALVESGEEVTVGRVVERSGVSRAAIYRRWSSMTDLVAAALDHGREPYRISVEGDLLENLLGAFLPGTMPAGTAYSEERFRLRLRLALSDRMLAQAYWRSHVARRRPGLVAVLRAGIERGELRGDLDLDACMDLITGVVYYQYVVRGATLADPAVVDRCREAIRVAWQGMSADGVSRPSSGEPAPTGP